MLEQMIRMFIAELRLTRSPHTAYNYEKHLQKFKKWVEEQKIDFRTIDSKQVRHFRNYLVDKGLNPRSVNTILSALKSFYDFLVDEGVVSGNPIIMKRVRVPEKKYHPKFLTDKELKVVLEEIKKLPKHIQLAFRTMLYAGLRVSEVANLNCDDVILQNNRIFLRVREGKGQKERYAIVVDEETAKELMEFSKGRQGSLFGVSASTLKHYAYKIQKTTGVHFHTHRLRHTFATTLLSRGVPIDVVQKAMGHSNISTTRRYAETLPEALEKLTVSVGKK